MRDPKGINGEQFYTFGFQLFLNQTIVQSLTSGGLAHCLLAYTLCFDDSLTIYMQEDGTFLMSKTISLIKFILPA